MFVYLYFYLYLAHPPDPRLGQMDKHQSAHPYGGEVSCHEALPAVPWSYRCWGWSGVNYIGHQLDDDDDDDDVMLFHLLVCSLVHNLYCLDSIKLKTSKLLGVLIILT